jgi:hypothetical protein
MYSCKSFGEFASEAVFQKKRTFPLVRYISKQICNSESGRFKFQKSPIFRFPPGPDNA